MPKLDDLDAPHPKDPITGHRFRVPVAQKGLSIVRPALAGGQRKIFEYLSEKKLELKSSDANVEQHANLCGQLVPCERGRRMRSRGAQRKIKVNQAQRIDVHRVEESPHPLTVRSVDPVRRGGQRVLPTMRRCIR